MIRKVYCYGYDDGSNWKVVSHIRGGLTGGFTVTQAEEYHADGVMVVASTKVWRLIDELGEGRSNIIVHGVDAQERHHIPLGWWVVPGNSFEGLLEAIPVMDRHIHHWLTHEEEMLLARLQQLFLERNVLTPAQKEAIHYNGLEPLDDLQAEIYAQGFQRLFAKNGGYFPDFQEAIHIRNII